MVDEQQEDNAQEAGSEHADLSPPTKVKQISMIYFPNYRLNPLPHRF